MTNLTQSQKSAAFDALVEWLMKAADEKKAESEKSKPDLMECQFDQGAWCAMEQASAMAVVLIGQIASQLSTPEQAENMPA